MTKADLIDTVAEKLKLPRGRALSTATARSPFDRNSLSPNQIR